MRCMHVVVGKDEVMPVMFDIRLIVVQLTIFFIPDSSAQIVTSGRNVNTTESASQSSHPATVFACEPRVTLPRLMLKISRTADGINRMGVLEIFSV